MYRRDRSSSSRAWFAGRGTFSGLDASMIPDPAIDAVATDGDIAYPSAIPFLLVHLGCLAAIWTGITWPAIALCVGLYWLRMFGVTAGYHRYFSHRSFATGRVFQFLLAFLAQSTAQRGVLWWAAKHRHHHRHSDTVRDVHSPRHDGFLYSHMGWIFARRHDAPDLAGVPDLTRYPELLWLQKFEILPAFVLAGVCFAVAGRSGLVVGFLWSTVLVYHATFCINSLAHVRGGRRYVTGDDSRNNVVLALLTMGEGWHNNHHAYPASARQGFKWWEVDPTYMILKMLAAAGIVRDLKAPPARVLRNEHQLGTRIIDRTAEQLAARFQPDRIALALSAALHGPQLTALLKALAEPYDRATEALASLHLPQMPSRAELVAQARAMFATTPSFDEIVDRGHALVIAAVRDRLAGPVAPVPAGGGVS
jgi:stearoyl-CoA desaturase (delta-9 desaturase)